jgi:hypothetical protein
MLAEAKKASLADVGVAAAVLAMFLFGILYGATGHPAALVAGCGGGLLLLGASLLAARAGDAGRPPPEDSTSE